MSITLQCVVSNTICNQLIMPGIRLKLKEATCETFNYLLTNIACHCLLFFSLTITNMFSWKHLGETQESNYINIEELRTKN